MRAFVGDLLPVPDAPLRDARRAGDASCLWMREFTELCKRVQFPISMSLPAILIEHVLAAGNGPLMPMLLVAFDAYTDGATAALAHHKQQHLFEEIEAEANLVLDQVLYSLSEQIFSHSARAAVALLAEFGLPDMPRDAGVAAAVNKCWFAPLLAAKHARSSPARRPRAAAHAAYELMIRLSIDHAIAKFESKSLDAVIDLLLDTRHAACRLHPGLAPRRSLRGVPRANCGPGDFSFSSRILTHVLTETLSDLIPNFAYRSDGGMFQRPLPASFTEAPERDAPPRAAGAHLGYGTRMSTPSTR